ncbi:Alpha/Beta hydrolase protein [Globomyces pollinis-pini]|nr:Alpha/Beta hydrolase protein [Globomyces pollinis-pini]
MPKFNVNEEGHPSVDIFYSVTGDGPNHIIFINGLGSILRQWDLQVDFFRELPEFSTLVYDNRGSGFSSAPEGRYSTSQLAKDAFLLLKHIGWQKVHIVGISMGGMIAQELSHLLENDVLSLTLVSTYSKFNGIPISILEPTDDTMINILNPRKLVEGSLKTIQQLFNTPGQNTIELFAEQTVEVLFPQDWLSAPYKGSNDEHPITNRENMHKFFVDRFSETGLQSPAGRFGQRNACLTHYFDRRLEELAAYSYPKLILTGDQDKITRQPISSEYLANCLRGKLVIYKNGGHALRMQDPEWHNQQLLDHFRSTYTSNEPEEE